MSIERVGIIGAGQMGGGIAHVCALSGYDVLIEDLNPDQLSRTIGTIEKNMHRQAARGLIKDESVEPALKRIKTTQNLDDMRDRDFVIEAATEDESVKRKIFQDLCPRLGPKTLIATNTSSISVTRLAASTDRPEHFIGLHFMNPVPMMQLVEVIRGIATDDTTFQTALDIVKRVGKNGGLCGRLPGVHRQPHPAADDQ
jgi:3-hydroxybutyryl-CoA dehydrogenase